MKSIVLAPAMLGILETHVRTQHVLVLEASMVLFAVVMEFAKGLTYAHAILCIQEVTASYSLVLVVVIHLLWYAMGKENAWQVTNVYVIQDMLVNLVCQRVQTEASLSMVLCAYATIATVGMRAKSYHALGLTIPRKQCAAEEVFASLRIVVPVAPPILETSANS